MTDLTKSMSDILAENLRLRHRVAELEKARDALRQSEKRRNLLLGSLPQKIFFKDNQSRFVTVNPAFAAEVGAVPAELVGKTDLDLYPRALAEKYRADDQRIMQGRVAVVLVERHCVGDEEFFVEVTKAPVIDDDGQVIGLMGVFVDITDRKRAQQELSRREQRYFELFENANDIVFTHDLTGRITSFNKAGLQLTGYSRDEVLAMNIAELVPSDDPSRQNLLADWRHASEAPLVYELHLLAKDGRRIPLEVSTRLIHENHRPIGVQGIARDITERRQAQRAIERQARLLSDQAEELERRNAELRRAYAELQEAESQLIHSEKMAAIGQLVAGLAHEINNPTAFVLTSLTAIRRDLDDVVTYTDLCRQFEKQLQAIAPEMANRLDILRGEQSVDLAVNEIRGLVESANSGMTRIRDLVLNLRSCTRTDNRGDFQMGDVNQGLRATLLILKPAAPKGVRIEFEPSELPLVECNLGQINQVFLNLVSNALQAVGLTGTVSIKTELDGDGILIRVRDDGPGVPPAIRSRIFDPFFTTKEVGCGTGLGLSISRRIVETHHGSIELDSQTRLPGETGPSGAEFRVWLPLRQRREQAPPLEKRGCD